MGVWDKTTPLGSDLKSQGDDRIRELKDALEEALSHEFSTFPGATPGSTPIFIPGFLRGATGARPTGDSLVEGRIYFNTTTNVIERYNGATWDAISTSPGADSVDGSMIQDDSIDSEHYVDGSIDKAHLSADCVDGTKIGDDSIDSEHIVDGSVDAVHLASDSVETAKIKDANVTEGKLADEVVNKLGQNIGLIARLSVTPPVNEVEQTLLSYTGQGRLGRIVWVGGAQSIEFKLVIDGIDHGYTSDALVAGYLARGAGATTFEGSASEHDVDVFFNTSIVVYALRNGPAGASPTIYIQYETD